jgi:hypothetical protein
VTPENKPGRIKKTRWFASLFIWWVMAVFFYLFIAADQTKVTGDVTAFGIATVLDGATKAGLPLLERDVQALTQLAQEVAKVNGVVNVSIIDHKNKIIAFTNPDQILAFSSTAPERKDGVRFWPHTLADGTQAICFSSDISYAGTKIGEVVVVMNARGASGLYTIFFLTAMVSLFVIVFVLLIIDFRGIQPLKAAIREKIGYWMRGDGALQAGREVICPVCGSHKPLTRSFLLEANLDRYPVVVPSRVEDGAAQRLLAQGVNLRDISRREDLGWLRRQMVHRCADIIKKLAGD